MQVKPNLARFLILTLVLTFFPLGVSSAQTLTSVFINEIHYDNSGTDSGEAIEIAGPAGIDLTGWSLVLYNGSGGASYNTTTLSGVIPNQQDGFGTLFFSYPTNGIQNGSPDGVALVDASSIVVQFLSYEGSFTAVGGPADGMTSIDIGVAESSSTAVGDSLQLMGTGSVYEDFTWSSPTPNTFGSVNNGQTFTTGPVNAPIVASCGGPLTLVEGFGASYEISASDEDGTVTDISLVSVVPPTGDITLSGITPAPGVGGTATANVDIASSLAPGDYTVTIGFSNDDTVPQTAECELDIEVVPLVPIYDIQGSGSTSPFEGQKVGTTGIVTLLTDDEFSFWMQDADGDGDPATSDGLYVFAGGSGTPPATGDFVVVIDRVSEYVSSSSPNDLPVTEFAFPYSVEVLSSGNLLPDPVRLKDLPNESILDGIDFWEPLEGMLVEVKNARVVGPTSPYGEFAMITRKDSRPGSGYFFSTRHLLIRSLGGGAVDYNPERILVDDSSLSEAIVVRPGDRVRELVGVVDYTFSNYKLQPVPDGFDIKTQSLPDIPASRRSGFWGDTTITTFNVENLFDLEDETGVVIDAIGQVGVDPGSQWGSGDTSTKDNTIRRQESICQGDSDQTDVFDPSLEWDGYANNTFDGLGTHTETCGSATGLFISEYVEGSSYNKAIEIYNGTGAPVDLEAGGYSVKIYFNGSDSAGQTVRLSGSIVDGDVFVLAHTSADAAILAEADQTSGSVLFNGDDAVTLHQGDKDDGGSTPTLEELDIQLTKLALAIEVELELPEIIVVQEVENTAILQELGDRVNGAAGTNYAATSFETSDGRGIEVGFLWDADRVNLLNAFQLTDAIVPGVSDAFGPDSPSPGREPLVGVFEIEGREITIIGNHFKSKGGDDPLFGVNWPPIRVTEVQRKMQATVVRDFVNSILDTDPAALVMVTGDLNDFQFSEPGEGPDHPVAILEGGPGEVPLINLINFERRSQRFTYVYDGNSQVLDHMLVSPVLLYRFRGVDVLHFNAGFPDALRGDETTTLRASDHDPIEGRFRFKTFWWGHH
jgi:predicted extracellular nuclease